ncbi:hypothetical protein NEDG_01543 [Nematocida displodere]|uniref:Calponin-homology (CH) domain-containing protein n=1 Tax=Nematocida displodere TaxID=1805483 RepID=A0A177EE57_9MICR|nr:hypothetical protein NEDG_01543 [Nematocida displodere]
MDRTSEVELLNWIKDLLALKIDEKKDDLMDLLGNGIVLCSIINKFIPKKCNPVDSTIVFKKMENVEQFLRAAREIGVLDTELFQTVDLVYLERRNPKQVCICLYSLSRNLKKMFPKSKFRGVGPTLASQNVRQFTQEQLDMGKRVISVQMGTNRGATQSGQGTGTRQITPTNPE